MDESTRRSPRHDIRAHVILHVAGAPPMAATICNISRHGIVIDSLASLSDDCDIQLEPLPGRKMPARFVWQDSFRSGLELEAPLSAEDYWSLLQQLDHCEDAAE